MIPDYDFDLFFRAEGQTAVAEAFARSASPDCRSAVSQVIAQGSGSTDLTLVVKAGDDAAVRKWDELSHIEPPLHSRIPGHVWIGAIDLKAEILERVPYDDRHSVPCLRVRLWPLTRFMQETFLNSPTLRKWVVELLATCGGVVCYIDRGDGSLAEFWPEDHAPATYEYELVRKW